jgi:hypothetical protein
MKPVITYNCVHLTFHNVGKETRITFTKIYSLLRKKELSTSDKLLNSGVWLPLAT